MLDSLDLSEYYMIKRFEKAVDNEDLKGQTIGANKLAEIYLAKNKAQKAKHFLDLAINLCMTHRYFDELKENYRISKKYWKKVNNYQKAFLIDEKYDSLKDVDFNQNKIDVLELQADFEKSQLLQEQQIVEQTLKFEQQQNAQQKLITVLLSIFSLLIVIVSIFLFRSRTIIRSKNKELRDKNELIKIQQDDIRHRFQNGLNRVSVLLKSVRKEVSDIYATQQLKRGEQMILTLASLESFLADNPLESKIEINFYLRDLVKRVIGSFAINPVGVKVDIENLVVDAEKLLSISLIISEIIINSLKHAFHEQQNPELNIEASLLDNKLLLEIKDNGRGFDSEKGIANNGEGQKLVRRLIKHLSGELKITSEMNKGTQYQLIIPL